MYEYGTYYIAVIGHPFRSEWTNVGIILFGEGGDQIGAKMDTVERAVRRGDLISRCGWDSLVENYPKKFPTIDSVHKSQEKTGTAMSRLRLIVGGVTAITPTALEEIYKDQVEV